MKAFMLVLLMLVGASAFAGMAREYPFTSYTPGVASSLTKAQLCATNYNTSEVVPASVKVAVLSTYGITGSECVAQTPGYVWQYSIPAILGGTSAQTNVWAQTTNSSVYTPQAKVATNKALLKRVCDDEMSLVDAQTAIKTDWRGAYKLYVNPDAPTPVPEVPSPTVTPTPTVTNTPTPTATNTPTPTP